MGRVKERSAPLMKIQRIRNTVLASIFLALALTMLPATSQAADRETNHSSHGASQPARNDPPTVGVPAIDFDLKTLDGQPIRLETFRGKPLMINFFASWCDPCREEMPLLNALAAKASSNGYSMQGIAVQDSRASVTQYAKEAGIIFPIALDLNSKVQRAYRIFGPPATFFIDAQGVLRDIVLGPITPERAREALEKAGVRR